MLVALALVATALGAGLRAAGSVTQGADRLQAATLAQWCADNALLDLQLRREFPGIGDRSADCPQAERRLSVQLRVRATPNPSFRRVDAVVSDEQGALILTTSTVLGRS